MLAALDSKVKTVANQYRFALEPKVETAFKQLSSIADRTGNAEGMHLLSQLTVRRKLSYAVGIDVSLRTRLPVPAGGKGGVQHLSGQMYP